MDAITKRMTTGEHSRHLEAAKRSAADIASSVEIIRRRLENGEPGMVEGEARRLLADAGELYARVFAANAVHSVIEIVRSEGDAPAEETCPGGC